MNGVALRTHADTRNGTPFSAPLISPDMTGRDIWSQISNLTCERSLVLVGYLRNKRTQTVLVQPRLWNALAVR